MNTYLFPFERRAIRRRRLVTLGLVLLAFLALGLFDRAGYHAFFVGEARLERIEDKDWYRAFRIAGTLWPWLFIAAAMVLHGLARQRRLHGKEAPEATAGLLILAAAVAAGALAEILQVVTGRLRPGATDGRTVFRGLFERFINSDGLGFPSSHAAVAFGAAFMICFLYPAAGVVPLVAALLCGLTRLLAGAHFLTDIFGAALAGYAMARLLRPGGWSGARRGLFLP